jgi:hypothetical protein
METIDRKKYGGKYVAMKSFTDKAIVASGKNAIKVYNKAVKRGIKEPVIDYIFSENVTYIF